MSTATRDDAIKALTALVIYGFGENFAEMPDVAETFTGGVTALVACKDGKRFRVTVEPKS